MPQKNFTFDFEDKSPKSIAYECEGAERLRTSVEGGVPFESRLDAGIGENSS